MKFRFLVLGLLLLAAPVRAFDCSVAHPLLQRSGALPSASGNVGDVTAEAIAQNGVNVDHAGECASTNGTYLPPEPFTLTLNELGIITGLSTLLTLGLVIDRVRPKKSLKKATR